MAVIRDLGLTVQSLEETSIITNSTAAIPGAGGFQSTNASTGNIAGATSTSTTRITANGRIIDRLTDLFTKDVPVVAMPATNIFSSRGSTTLNRKWSIGVKLQHGDSSGGGDLVDYSTGSQQDDAVYFTCARTTDYANWSTGAIRKFSDPSYYDLRAAKRYIRAVHYADKYDLTTESTGDEGSRISGTITFLGGSTPKSDLKGIGSTSTST